MIDHHTAQAPLKREFVPTMEQWKAQRHRSFDAKQPGVFARLFTVSREKLARTLGGRG